MSGAGVLSPDWAGTDRPAEPGQVERIDAALLGIAHFFTSREVHALVQSAGVPPAYRALFPALRAVRDLAAPVSTKDVQGALGLSHPATCRVIDRCVAQGLVDRQVSAVDRRHTVLQLTPAGRAAAQAVEGARQDVVAMLVDGWSAPDRAALLEWLERLEPELGRIRALGSAS